jgi:hypothetical protein
MSDPNDSEVPVGAYAVLMTGFAALFGALLAMASRRRALPRRISSADIVCLGVATHKLTRIVTRDRVTLPLRLPFVRYVGSAGAGEVKESVRGNGLRQAVGSLLTCSFCAAPWIASALTAAFVARPRETRVFATMLDMVTISDFLQHAYARAKQLSG